jgi:hypothetical protein
MKRIRLLLVLSVVLLAGLFLVLSWQNSLALTAVSIRIKDGMKEHTDHTVLGFGAEHHLPDYKVKLRVSRRLLAIDLGTRLNTSATNWVEYSVNELIPVRHVQELMVIEDDRAEDDVLDRVQGTGLEREGASFKSIFVARRSFEVGMNWFFGTPLGKAVSAGVVVGIVLLILSLFRGV